MPFDLTQVRRILAGIAGNPNVGAVLLVGLGCEGVPSDELAAAISAMGKPVETVMLQEVGGYTNAVERGIQLGKKLKADLDLQQRKEAPISRLSTGLKCGASDATMGMIANPAVGLTVDRLIELGGSAIFCETTEALGAEHLLADKAVNPEVARRLLEAVAAVEREAGRFGTDMRGGQPTPGNMAGGISTIEEKSLGAVCKAGSSPLQGVLDYGQAPEGRGLFFMDSPGREMEVFAGLASTGVQVMLFATGRGAPQGFPIAPVIKICANAATCERLREHIDLDISAVLSHNMRLEEAGELIFKKMLSVASGELTKAEILGFTETMNIYVHGPVI
jgi:altronate dehydratase large subunit